MRFEQLSLLDNGNLSLILCGKRSAATAPLLPGVKDKHFIKKLETL